MAPNHLFWVLTFFWTLGLLGVAIRGVQHIRRGDVVAHRRAMNRSIAMVGIFVLAYVAKVIFLGKENIHLWTPGERAILYWHESMIAVMLLSGGRARWLARRVGRGEAARAPGFEVAAVARQHRLAGRVALVAGLLALGTAGLVLWGMLGRGA